MSSSKPPDYDEEPENNDEEYDVPQPTTALSSSHVVHPSEGARKNARGLRKHIVHLTELDCGFSNLVSYADSDILQHLHLRLQTFKVLVVLPFEVICEALPISLELVWR